MTRDELIAFLLEQAGNQPVSRRVGIYRALAELCPDDSEELLSLSEALEAVESKSLQLVFHFSQRKP